MTKVSNKFEKTYFLTHLPAYPISIAFFVKKLRLCHAQIHLAFQFFLEN